MQLGFVDDDKVRASLTLHIEDLVTGEELEFTTPIQLGEKVVSKGKKSAFFASRRAIRRNCFEAVKTLAKPIAVMVAAASPPDGWKYTE